MRHKSKWSTRSPQQGAVLYIALILLLILTIIGVAASRLQTGEAVMARNDHNHQLALQAAEAALRDAEINLADGNWTIAQFAANTNGLYVLQTGEAVMARNDHNHQLALQARGRNADDGEDQEQDERDVQHRALLRRSRGPFGLVSHRRLRLS